MIPKLKSTKHFRRHSKANTRPARAREFYSTISMTQTHEREIPRANIKIVECGYKYEIRYI